MLGDLPEVPGERGGDDDDDVVVAPAADAGSDVASQAAREPGTDAGGRFVPPQTIKDSSIEEPRKYIQRVRVWAKVSSTVPPNLRGVHITPSWSRRTSRSRASSTASR